MNIERLFEDRFNNYNLHLTKMMVRQRRLLWISRFIYASLAAIWLAVTEPKVWGYCFVFFMMGHVLAGLKARIISLRDDIHWARVSSDLVIMWVNKARTTNLWSDETDE